MLENLKSIQRKHITFIGENAVDIVLYISRLCSLNQKVLLVDLSSTGRLIDIVSPDGNMENHNVRFCVFSSLNIEITKSYDLIITYSDMLQFIPHYLLVGDTYYIIASGKNALIKLQKDIKYLRTNEKAYMVYRGCENTEMIIKRMIILGIEPHIIRNMIFLTDNISDYSAMRCIEYNSVFDFINLSQELRRFIKLACNRIDVTLDITELTLETRCKWVM